MNKKISLLNIIGDDESGAAVEPAANPFQIVGQEPETPSGKISRRSFLKGAGGSAAAAVALTGCADKASQEVYPNLMGDAATVPGIASWFKSTCTQCAAGCGIINRVVDGRVVKVEGNPDHPVNRGGVCALGHSGLQDHYDPDRVREPLEKVTDANGKSAFVPISWDAAYKKLAEALNKKGKKAFISKPYTGSTAQLLQKWTTAAEIEHHNFNLFDQPAVAAAYADVFGEDYYGLPELDFAKAEVILNFGADFLETWVNPTGYARGWSEARRAKTPVRFFHVEPRLSLTGANADHWLAAKPGTEIYIAAAILGELSQNARAKAALPANIGELVKKSTINYAAAKSGITAEKISYAVTNLTSAKQSLVLAGGTANSSSNSRQLQIIVNYINVALGNIGKTVQLDKLRPVKSDFTKLADLTEQMIAGEYSVLFVDDSNPSFKLPGALRFEYGLKTLDMLVSFASHLDETTAQADLILPKSSSFESWGDQAPYQGINSLIQPVMTPIFSTKDLGDILLTSLKDKAADPELAEVKTNYDYIKAQWQKLYTGGVTTDAKTFEKFWESAIEAGGYFPEDSTESLVPTAQLVGELKVSAPQIDETDLDNNTRLKLLPFTSIKTFDGSAANRPWLQELPDPITKVAWDTWAEISEKTAKKLKIETGDLLKIGNYYGEINVPAFVTKYVNEDVIAVPIGNGHSDYGRYASSVEGGNVCDLLPGKKALSAEDKGLNFLTTSITVSKAAGLSTLVRTQEYFDQGDRHLARTEEIKPVDLHEDHHDDGHHGGHHEPPQMYEQREHPVYEWGMGIDLASCTGCSACVTACYAENNIPTVGKEVMAQGREMSWLRIDNYMEENAEELSVNFLPMMCQHCNNAPCEPVCPVYATYHNEEGLNAMIYNRCVGTRYCANNCSYKVRRFNWFEFEYPEPLDMQLNPDVTKRVAGVMEKCTFCVQRITDKKDTAKDEGRLVQDGEVQPACVQSCPTQAMVFGNLNDPKSKVSKWAKKAASYKVLDHHLNTQPAVSYLPNRKYDVKSEEA